MTEIYTSRISKELERLRRYDKELSSVMPPDFKDWHQNSKEEWPELAAWVIKNLREQQEILKDFQEETEKGLRDAMKQAKKDGVFDEKIPFNIIEEWAEKNKRPSLYEILMEWWINDDWTDQTDESIIDNLVDIIDDQFIPPHHDTNDYQWNKCLKLMRDKLR